MRSSGILMPISSLSSPCGIGTLGAAAREFADFLAAGGQTYWQILPRYLAIDFATALVIMYTSKFIKKKWPAVSARLKRALLEEKNG